MRRGNADAPESFIRKLADGIRKLDADAGALVLFAFNQNLRFIRIQQPQPGGNVAQADAVFTFSVIFQELAPERLQLVRRAAGAVVLDGEANGGRNLAVRIVFFGAHCAHNNMQRFPMRKVRAVLGGVLDQRLKEQLGHHGVKAVRRDFDGNLNAVAIAPAENIRENFRIGNLLLEGDEMVGIERVMNQFAEFENQIGRGIAISERLHAFAMDEVERVENKMRVNLRLQRPEPHVAEHLHLRLQLL